MSKLPWFKFYPADWRAEPALRMVSMEARGLWIECMCLMHEAEPYGHLRVRNVVMDEQRLALMCGTSEQNVRACLHELERAGVLSRTRDGVIYCRRMVRDEAKRSRAQANGNRGGDPDLVRLKEASGRLQTTARFSRKDNPTKVQAVWEACGGKCSLCSQAMVFEHDNSAAAFEVDHVVPLTLGGTNALSNLRGVCKSCNLKEAKKSGRNLVLVSGGATPAPNPDSKLRGQKLETRREANASVEAVFDALWPLWPAIARKRHPQQKVRDAIANQLKLGNTADQIIQAGRAHVAERLAKGPEFVKGLVPWLSQGLWKNWVGDEADETERKRRLWVFQTYGDWRPDWGPRPDADQSEAQGGNP